MRLLLLAAALAALPAAAQNGTLDPTFGTGGRVVLDPSGTLQSQAADVAVLPDGRILLAGRVGDDAAVIRLTAAGALDPTYGAGGIRTVDLGGPVRDIFTDMVLRSDGSVVVCGAAVGPDDEPLGGALARFTPDGVLDTDFGDGGIVREAQRGVVAFVSLAARADGSLVATGRTEAADGDSEFVAAGYLADGTPDAAFGTGGLAAPAAVVEAASAVVTLDAAGRAVLAGLVTGPGGFFDTQILTFRLTRQGALDAAFSGDGLATADFGPAFDIALAILSDQGGRVTVGGGSLDYDTGTADLLLLRYTDAGAPDATFGTEGVVRSSGFGPATRAVDLAVQEDGKLLVGGAAGDAGDFLLARYSEAGALDPTFGTGGRTTVSVGEIDIAAGLAFEATGRVIIAGQTGDTFTANTSLAVARFLTDGRPVAAETPAAEARLALAAAPNPFGNQTAVTVTLAEAGAARVAVYDALGRRVAVLHDGPLAAGVRRFRIDGADLAPGVYVVRAEGAGGGAAVRLVRR